MLKCLCDNSCSLFVYFNFLSIRKPRGRVIILFIMLRRHFVFLSVQQLLSCTPGEKHCICPKARDQESNNHN